MISMRLFASCFLYAHSEDEIMKLIKELQKKNQSLQRELHKQNRRIVHLEKENKRLSRELDRRNKVLPVDSKGAVVVGNLKVNGIVSMRGRKGIYKTGQIPADGKWHNVLSDLNHHRGYEVIANVGKDGLHGLTYAIVVKTYMGDGESAGY